MKALLLSATAFGAPAAHAYDNNFLSLLKNVPLMKAMESGNRPGYVRSQLAQVVPSEDSPQGYWSTTVSGFSAWTMCATIFGSGIAEEVVMAEERV